MKNHSKYHFQFVIDDCKNNLKTQADRITTLRKEIELCKKLELEEWKNIDQLQINIQNNARQLVDHSNEFQLKEITLYYWTSSGFHSQKRLCLNNIQHLQNKYQNLQRLLLQHEKLVKDLFKKLNQYEAHKQKIEWASKNYLKQLDLKKEEDFLVLNGSRRVKK